MTSLSYRFEEKDYFSFLDLSLGTGLFNVTELQSLITCPILPPITKVFDINPNTFLIATRSNPDSFS